MKGFFDTGSYLNVSYSVLFEAELKMQAMFAQNWRVVRTLKESDMMTT